MMVLAKLISVLILIQCGLVCHGQQPTETTILGRGKTWSAGTTVTLTIFERGYLSSNPFEFQETYQGNITDGEFSFQVSLGDSQAYFLLKIDNWISKIYLIGRGDSIQVCGINSGGLLTGEGKGFEKIRIQNLIYEVDRTINPRLKRDDAKFIKRDFELKDSAYQMKKKILLSHRNHLDTTVFESLWSDIVAENMSKGYYVTHYKTGEDRSSFVEALKEYVTPLEITDDEIYLQQRRGAYYSFAFASAVFTRFHFDSCYRRQRDFDTDGFLAYSTRFEGGLRDKLLAYLIFTNKKSVEVQRLVDAAIPMLSDSTFRSTLTNIGRAYTVGTDVSGYSLMDENGEQRMLSDFKGRVIVMDFWYTGCPACPHVLPYLERIENEFQAEEVTLISVSIDKDLPTWQRSVNKHLYTLENSEYNFYTGGLGKAHPLITHFRIASFPTILVFDKEGKMCEVPIDPRKDNGDNLTTIVRKHVSK